VKLAKHLFITRKSPIPLLRFEKQDLSSFSGLVVFQKLFAELNLSSKLSECSPGSDVKTHTSYSLLFRLLIVHALIGMRKLREVDLYREDPMVKRVFGVGALPSIPTMSRLLDRCDDRSVSGLREQSRDLVLQRLGTERLATVTLDFDGSVILDRAQGRRSGGRLQ